MTALLQPEIFVQIFRHLLQPLPEPNSTANTSKSSVRQKSLNTCLLVSKQFYNLAAPVLYQTIVTDNLPLLFRTLRPIDGIISKTELLGLTKHLYIEYAEDSSVHIRRIPPSGSDNPRTIMAEEFSRRSFIAIQLAEDLFISWRGIFNHHDRRKPLFASLETLSTGAFFGHQKEIYWYSAEYSPRWVDLLEMARWGLYTMLRDTPSIRHFCGAGWGPLTLGDLPRPFKGGENVPVIARHLIKLPIEDPYIVKLHDIYACTGTDDSRKILRVPIGVENVWYVHTQANEAIAMIRTAYQTTLGLRDKLAKDPDGVNDEERNWAHGESNTEVRRVYSDRYPATEADWDMKGALYLDLVAKSQLGSARSEQDEEDSRRKAEDKEQQMLVELALGERELFGGMKVQDRLSLRSIFDERCEACGWSPDKRRRGGSAAVSATEPDSEPESMSTPNSDLGETESELESESDPEPELEMKSVSDPNERDRLISLPTATSHAVPDSLISFAGGTRRFLWVVGVVIVGSIFWNRFG